jgi:hypothetical protein
VYLRADGENAEVRTKLWPILTAIEGDEKELNGSMQEVQYIRTQPISESNTARVKAANIPQQIERLILHKSLNVPSLVGQ